jgi:hypothetical protein
MVVAIDDEELPTRCQRRSLTSSLTQIVRDAGTCRTIVEANKIPRFENEFRAHTNLFSQTLRRACQERNFQGQRRAPRNPEMPGTETELSENISAKPLK